MFYSPEMLTSPKHGFATVWLAATLGIAASSSRKKITRKAILKVNVARTCETIVTTDAPMALRLQSNLLYGVARVYAKQCGYVLTNTEHAFSNMRMLLKNIHTISLEQEGGTRGREDQLILPDDPRLLADLNLDLDLTTLRIDLGGADLNLIMDDTQSLLSPAHSQKTTVSHQPLGDLDIPASNSPGGGGFSDINMFGLRSGSGLNRRSDDQRVLDFNADFHVDEDGTLHITDDVAEGPGQNHQAPSSSPPSPRDLTHETGIAELPYDVPIDMDLDDDLAAFGGSGDSPNEDAPYEAKSSQAGGTLDSDEPIETAQAPQRRRKTRSVMPLDTATSLRNTDLGKWNAEYLANQRILAQQKQSLRLQTLAKQNAEGWMLCPAGHMPMHPSLQLFTGVSLVETFTGVSLTSPSGLKRVHEADASLTERHVRPRRDSPLEGEMRRAYVDDDQIVTYDEEEQLPGEVTVEQGRKAPTPLDEQPSSLFPWNQSDSRVRSDSYLERRRATRLVSASPLQSRGVNNPVDSGGAEDWAGGFSDDMYPPAPDNEDANDGNGGEIARKIVGEHEISESQQSRLGMFGETAKFLIFVKDALISADLEAIKNGESEILPQEVNFENLVPPTEHNVVVAANAFLHVLTLATGGALAVTQNTAFGSISLQVVEPH